MECCLSACAGNSPNKPTTARYGLLAKRLHSYSNEAAGMSQEGEITSRKGAGRFRRPRAGRWYFTESYAQQRLQGQTVSPPPTLHHLPEPFAKQLVRAAKGTSHLSILCAGRPTRTSSIAERGNKKTLNILFVLNTHHRNQGYTQAVNLKLWDSTDSARVDPAETWKDPFLNSSVKYTVMSRSPDPSIYPCLAEMGCQQLVATGY